MIIDQINRVVVDEPHISRRALSRRVCEWLNWRLSNGGLQDGSCRKALAELHRRGVLRLPEVAGNYAFQLMGISVPLLSVLPPGLCVSETATLAGVKARVLRICDMLSPMTVF